MAVKLDFQAIIDKKAIYLFLPLNSFSILEQAVLEKTKIFFPLLPLGLFKSIIPFVFRSPETKNVKISTQQMLLLAYAHSINFLMKKSNDDTLHSCHLNSLDLNYLIFITTTSDHEISS